MTKLKTNLSFAAVACLIAVGATYAPKTYPVSHTEAEWVQHINGLANVQNVIHQSNLPAREAFWCDSVLQAQILDINKQVVAGMVADTTTKKGGKP
jgi:hypothetical protein